MLQVASTSDALRPRREPDEHALLGIEVLGLGHLKPRARLKEKRALKYHWFAGRNGALAAVGRVAESDGPIAARMAADAVLSRIDEGLDPTTREAVYIIREAAHRLSNLRDINGGRP
jgi:hypothetical protein